MCVILGGKVEEGVAVDVNSIKSLGTEVMMKSIQKIYKKFDFILCYTKHKRGT